MFQVSKYDQLARQLAPIACEAGRLLLEIQQSPQGVFHKEDGTPTCPADTQAEALIVPALRTAFPSIPIISEERVKDEGIGNLFFLVDPLDGTADFIDNGSEFCVNIALVENGRPTAAVIHAPASARTWLAGETASEIFGRNGEPHHISTRISPPGRLTALTSNRYGDCETENCLDALPLGARLRISSAIKFCLIAEGTADIYIRHGRTMEWDTAAGDLILTRAGGTVIGLDGERLRYGRADQGYANDSFIALGDPELARSALSTCRRVFGQT